MYRLYRFDYKMAFISTAVLNKPDDLKSFSTSLCQDILSLWADLRFIFQCLG